MWEFALGSAQTRGPYGFYQGQIGLRGWLLPPVRWLLVLGTIVSAIGFWIAVLRRELYWRLERLTRYVGLISGSLWVGAMVLYFSGAGGYRYVMGGDVWRTVWFSAFTALLWAASCRVWLLFRLVKYEKMRMVKMAESPECFACEYDLTGSLRGGVMRCPECGTRVPLEVAERFAGGVRE